ncbi:type III secretion system translocon subunit SctE [Citrobacter sp. U14242]|uniref:type III secretion system translocon subunit SctE n=1 Tax=Citrobacter sp. U14242 TaxID=3390192 RepID=UPI003979ECE4
MLGVTAKPATQVTPQANSESDVERVTIAKNDVTTTNSSEGNAALKIVQEKLVTKTDKSAMTGDPWKPMLRAPSILPSGLTTQQATAPTTTAKTESQTYEMAEVLAKLSVALGDSAIATQKLRSQTSQIINNSASAITTGALADVENARAEVNGAEAGVQSAQAQKENADQILTEANAAVNNASKALDDANQAFANVHSDVDYPLSSLKASVSRDIDSLKDHSNQTKASFRDLAKVVDSIAQSNLSGKGEAQQILTDLQAIETGKAALIQLIKDNPASISDPSLLAEMEAIVVEIQSLLDDVGKLLNTLVQNSADWPDENEGRQLRQYAAEVKKDITDAKEDLQNIKVSLASIKTLRAQIAAAEDQVAIAKNVLQQAVAAQVVAQNNVALAAQNIAAAQQALNTANASLNEANAALPTVLNQTQALQQLDKLNKSQTGNGINKVDLLMAELVTILGKCNEETLKNNMALAKTQQAAKQAELEKQTEKSEKETAKQKRMNKIFGWVSKVVGAIMMVAGAITAIISGGATAVFFVIGLALTTSDLITKAVTGVSFMAKAFGGIVDGIAKMFEAMGISAMISKILAVITLIALMIVIAVLTKKGMNISGLSKLLGRVTTHIGASVAKVTAKAMAKITTKKIMFGSAKKVIRVSAKVTMYASMAASQSISAGSSVGNGVYEQRRDEISAQLMEIMKDTDFVRQLMDIVLENYSNTMKTMNAIIKGETEASGMSMQVGKQILAQTRA